jgi:hypothetical protein
MCTLMCFSVACTELTHWLNTHTQVHTTHIHANTHTHNHIDTHRHVHTPSPRFSALTAAVGSSSPSRQRSHVCFPVSCVDVLHRLRSSPNTRGRQCAGGVGRAGVCVCCTLYIGRLTSVAQQPKHKRTTMRWWSWPCRCVLYIVHAAYVAPCIWWPVVCTQDNM